MFSFPDFAFILIYTLLIFHFVHSLLHSSPNFLFIYHFGFQTQGEKRLITEVTYWLLEGIGIKVFKVYGLSMGFT